MRRLFLLPLLLSYSQPVWANCAPIAEYTKKGDAYNLLVQKIESAPERTFIAQLCSQNGALKASKLAAETAEILSTIIYICKAPEGLNMKNQRDRLLKQSRKWNQVAQQAC